MSRRLLWSLRAFHMSLAALLFSGVLSAAAWQYGRPDLARLCNGAIILCDEVLTPDSSRFWPRVSYRPGRPQASFDKQYVRDYLEDIRFNKKPPGPELPESVVKATTEKYLEAYRFLTGSSLV